MVSVFSCLGMLGGVFRSGRGGLVGGGFRTSFIAVCEFGI